MKSLLMYGYRVIANYRRCHGRFTQTASGHDMDHYADDLAALTEHLDLRHAVHVGHSTGGGEVVHYLARHGDSRVRSEEHTSELQSRLHLVCRLLLEKKKKKKSICY